MLEVKTTKEEVFRIDAIYNEGHIGQIVIFPGGVNFTGATHTDLADCKPYSLFTIVEKNVIEYDLDYSSDYSYILQDTEGNKIEVSNKGGDTSYIYDAQEWLSYRYLKNMEIREQYDKKIKDFENKEKILMDILLNQGIKVISKFQANELGIDYKK